MLNFEDVFRLPSERWEDKSQLPEWSGVYFLCANKRILYIGKANNFRERWARHHRNHEANIISLAGSEVRIHYLAIAPLPKWSNSALLEVESELIKLFDPIFNATPVSKTTDQSTTESSSPGRILDVQLYNLFAFEEASDKIHELMEESMFLLEKGVAASEIINNFWMDSEKSIIAALYRRRAKSFIVAFWNKVVPNLWRDYKQMGITPTQYYVYQKLKRAEQKRTK